MRAAGPAIYIIRHYNRVNQLYKSSSCVDGTSNTCLCNDFIRICFVVIGSTSTASNVRSWGRCFCIVRVVLQMQGYARVPSKTPILPASARSNVRSRMLRFVKCWRARQPYANRI